MAAFATALVTGASSGIGRAVARELARRGTCVVLAARREPELRDLAGEIERAGGRADVALLDVRDTEAVHALVQRKEREHGGLDLVLANAGVGYVPGHDPLDWPALRELLLVNAVGAVATLAAALPTMRARGRGTLAGMSSLASVRGMPGSGAYSATKALLSTFLESLQIDLAESGVRVVDVQPGFVRTPMTAQNRGPMPFLMEVEAAALRTVDGLERGAAVVAYPWPMAFATRTVARHVPRSLWRAFCTRSGWKRG